MDKPKKDGRIFGKEYWIDCEHGICRATYSEFGGGMFIFEPNENNPGALVAFKIKGYREYLGETEPPPARYAQNAGDEK